MKHTTICLLIGLLFPTYGNSQTAHTIYGEFWGFSGTLYIKPDNTVVLNEKSGFIQDSLVIFDADTLVLRRYEKTDYFYMAPLQLSCGSYNTYFLKKEYWANGNIKQDRSFIRIPKKGYVLHGETIWYNEDGTIKEVKKYRKGKER